ncbi:MAG: RNA polymerase sigma factor [Flammeovirgaceae bacterium]|nr:RNA polymerase sigma factor [Flammeovirgaceae bacterium]
MVQYYDLLQNCIKGDAKAQRILYDLFKSRLMGLCRRYTHTREEAQDVLQETFIKIFRKLHQLESPEKLEGWVKSIAVRTAINSYRKTKKELLLSIPEEDGVDTTAELTIVSHFTDEFLIKVINDLPDGCRLVFNLFEIEGYNHGEIAEMLGISEGTSRSQLHHAKSLLKSQLKKTGVEYGLVVADEKKIRQQA